MAIKFYLNNQEVKLETNATFLSTQDDTFDTGTFDLEWTSTIKNAIAPQTPFRIEDTTKGEEWNFVIIGDTVSVVKKSTPNVYKHSSSVIQNTHELSTHNIRNSSFSQPINNVERIIFNTIGYFDVTYYNNEWQDSITFYPAKQQTKQEAIDSAREKNSVYRVNYVHDGIKKFYNATFKIKTMVKSFRNVSGTATYSNPYDWEYDILRNATIYIRVNGYEIYHETVATSETNIPLSIFNNLSKGDVVSIEITNPRIDSQYHDFNFAQTQDVYYKARLSLFQCQLELRTYYYSLYDVLEKVEKQARKHYNGSDHFSIYTMPTRASEQGQELERIIAPEFQFTSQDAYSIVAEVLQYIDAVPTLTKDGVLGFEYLNDISRTPSTINRTDRTATLTEEYYTNKLIANYQNGRQPTPITYPSKKSYARIGSSQYGIPTRDDYQINLPKTIDTLVSVNLRYTDKVNIRLHDNYQWTNLILDSFDTTIYNGIDLPHEILDLSPSIIETSLYTLLKMDEPEDSFPNKLNSSYYSQGGKSIYVGGVQKDDGLRDYDVYQWMIKWSMAFLFGFPFYYWYSSSIDGYNQDEQITSISIPSKQNLQFQVVYNATFDGRVSIESTEAKHEGETYVSQSSASVQLNRFGTNMQGLIARLGNQAERFVLDMTPFGSRIKKGSLWVDDDGNKYIANKVKTTFSTSSQNCIVEVEFTKNFNALSSYTKLDQEKRFYEISERLTSKGYENITEFLYFSTDSNTKTYSTQVAFNKVAVESIVIGTLNNTNIWTSDIATLQVKTNEDDNSFVDLGSVNNTDAFDTIAIPIHTYGLGNMLCFEMGYDSPINAGDRLVGDGTSSHPYTNKTTLYTESSGFADEFEVWIASERDRVSYMGDEYPLIDLTDIYGQVINQPRQLIRLSNFRYYKKPNEIFHLNYEIALMPYPKEEIYFGENFVNNNAIINGIIPNIDGVDLYIGTTDEELYSIIDKKALGTKAEENVSVSLTWDSGLAIKGTITIEPTQAIPPHKSWCLADKNGNILIAVNKQSLTEQGTLQLYFFSRDSRV